MKKELWFSYLLAILCLFGPAGLHRFYLGRPVSALLYLFTWGFLGVGTVIDLIVMSDLVRSENAKLLEQHLAPGLPAPASTSPERQILQLARRQGGKVTVAMVALETNLSLDQAKKELERLRRQGHCDIDVNEEGAEMYAFVGLGSTTPLLPPG